VHRPGRCGVGKCLGRAGNAAPDRGALVIAGGRGFVGHFVRAIGVIVQVDRVGMAPAFSGRISLSKGWELGKRFSECVDFKVGSASRARLERTACRERVLNVRRDATAAGNRSFMGEGVRGFRAGSFVRRPADLTTRLQLSRRLVSLVYGSGTEIAR
jgi:hypothetical protein